MNQVRPLFGLVLAGGISRRMGRDKAALHRDGQTQLEFAFGLLQSCTERQFVSVREGQERDPLRARYPQIVDQQSDIGPIAGILAALELHPDADWLVVACDLPNLDAQTLRHLLDNAPPDVAMIAFRSSSDALPEPLCAIYRAVSRTIIRGMVDEGVVCPRKIMIRSGAWLLQLPTPSALENINTPDQLEHSVLEATR